MNKPKNKALVKGTTDKDMDGYFVMERNLKVEEPTKEQIEFEKRKDELDKKYNVMSVHRYFSDRK